MTKKRYEVEYLNPEPENGESEWRIWEETNDIDEAYGCAMECIWGAYRARIWDSGAEEFLPF